MGNFRLRLACPYQPSLVQGAVVLRRVPRTEKQCPSSTNSHLLKETGVNHSPKLHLVLRCRGLYICLYSSSGIISNYCCSHLFCCCKKLIWINMNGRKRYIQIRFPTLFDTLLEPPSETGHFLWWQQDTPHMDSLRKHGWENHKRFQ